MGKSNKIDQKDLEKITLAQKKRQTLVNKLGELEYTKAQIVHALNGVTNEVDKVSASLAKKYGNVDINLNTGEIVDPPK